MRLEIPNPRTRPGTTFTRYWGEVGGLIRMATAEDVARIAAECDAVVGTSSD